MLEKALILIADKLESVLQSKGFKRRLLDENAIVFTGKDENFVVSFYNNKIMLLKYVGDLTDVKSMRETSQNVCEWFFDPNTSDLGDAKSIANDFVDIFSKPSKKSGKNFSGETEKSKVENDSLPFFLNRLLTIFPELKSKLTSEKNEYSKVRYVLFIKENFVPLFLGVLSDDKVNKDKVKKIANVLNNFYINGNMDVRSTITMVILNAVDDSKLLGIVNDFLDNNLKEASLAARKYKLKKVKPEKLKKTFMSKFLAANKTLL